MSDGSDEIVFGEMTYREPQRLRRPDRDRRKACIAYGVPGPGELPIFLDRRPADAIERHALRDTSVELGGILLGKECVDDETGQPFVWITEALEAKHYENTQASFTYTHDSWEEITRERDLKYPDLDIVGWYHTHPDFGVFLSSHDLFIHHHFFAQPLQVAYVVDPIRQTRGFFQWYDGQMMEVGGFYLTADRSERLALARLVNDLENLPNPEGGGSGLSPRLEAELIAMLTRPHSTTVVDRSQTAAVFSLLGLTIGSLAVGILLWMYTLGNTLRDQAQAVAELARLQKQAEAAQAKEIDAARTSAKEQALDALLADLRVGDPPESIRARFTETMQEVNALKGRIARLQMEKDALTEHAGTLKSNAQKLADEIASLREKNEESEKLNRDDVQQRDSQIDRLRNEIARKETLIESGETGELNRKYNWAFWAAVTGWLAFAMSLLGLIAVMARQSDESTSRFSISPMIPPLASQGPTIPQPQQTQTQAQQPPHSDSTHRIE